MVSEWRHIDEGTSFYYIDGEPVGYVIDDLDLHVWYAIYCKQSYDELLWQESDEVVLDDFPSIETAMEYLESGFGESE